MRPPVFPRVLLSLVVSLVATVPGALAHDDPDHAFGEMSARIEREPDSAALYLERAEVSRGRRDWAAALADLQAASNLEPSMAAVDLALARLMLDSGNYPAGVDAADRFLSRRPGDAGGHVLKARILFRSGAWLEAATEYGLAVELDRKRRGDAAGMQPDDFLDRARALDNAGRTADAVAGLDEGLEILGHPVTLQLLAIDLDEKRGNLDGALARVASLEHAARRKESWMARRGDLLAAAGRTDDARAAWRAALESITALPTRARDNEATLALEASVRAKLAAAAESVQ